MISKRLLILALAALPLLAACQKPPAVNADGSLNSPFWVDIKEPHTAGNKVDVLARLACDAYYVSLRFYFDRDSPQDRNRVRALVGGDDRKVGPDKYYVYGNGVPFPVRLTVAEITATGERVVLRREGSFPLTSWGGDSFGKVIMSERLLTGLYRVRLDILSNSPAYTGTRVRLLMTGAPKAFTPAHLCNP